MDGFDETTMNLLHTGEAMLQQKVHQNPRGSGGGGPEGASPVWSSQKANAATWYMALSSLRSLGQNKTPPSFGSGQVNS